jgi:ribosomal protein S18 acetylase RimI-like enzyme
MTTLGMSHASSATSSASSTMRRREMVNPLDSAKLLIFRPFGLRDCAPVFHLGEDLFTAELGVNIYRDWDQWAVTGAFSTDPKTCIVCESLDPVSQRSKVIGFLLGITTHKDGLHIGYIQWIGVRTHYQRKHIATTLFQMFLEACRPDGVRKIMADTQASNSVARAFFRKCGFMIEHNHTYMHLNVRLPTPDALKTEKSRLSTMPTPAGKLEMHTSLAHETIPPNYSFLNDRDEIDFTYTARSKSTGRSMEIHLTQMGLDDLYPVYEMGRELFTQGHPNLYYTWDETTCLDIYQGDPEYCLVARIEGKKEPVAFLLSNIVQKQGSSWKYGYLIWQGVSGTYQGLGIGKQLFFAFHELMVRERCRMLIMDTEQSNVQAIAFFTSLGFGHPEPHVYVELNLDEHGQPIPETPVATVMLPAIAMTIAPITVVEDDEDGLVSKSSNAAAGDSSRSSSDTENSRGLAVSPTSTSSSSSPPQLGEKRPLSLACPKCPNGLPCNVTAATIRKPAPCILCDQQAKGKLFTCTKHNIIICASCAASQDPSSAPPTKRKRRAGSIG